LLLRSFANAADGATQTAMQPALQSFLFERRHP